MKLKLDERQKQEENNAAARSFLVMFALSVAAIVIQMCFFKESFRTIAGETVVLLGGSIMYLAGCLKRGLFLHKGRHLSIVEMIVLSVIFSGIFSIFFGIMVFQNTQQAVFAGRAAGGFFAGVSVLCFCVLLVMSKCSLRQQQKNERKYDE